jgi:hypothetical protein
VLGQRFFPRSVVLDALLLARLACALEDLPEAARQLAWVEAKGPEQLPPAGHVLLTLARRVVEEARGSSPHEPEAWAALIEESRNACTADERLEVLVWAAHSARASGNTVALQAYVAEASEVAQTAPLWTERVQALLKLTPESP